MSVQEVRMARYVHKVGNHVFEIDVAPMTSTSDTAAQVFVACIRQVDHTDLVPVMYRLRRREVYGPTEAWALQNARDLLAAP
jgi:hypothetical protein